MKSTEKTNIKIQKIQSDGVDEQRRGPGWRGRGRGAVCVMSYKHHPHDHRGGDEVT